jgi:hypothetical protein
VRCRLTGSRHVGSMDTVQPKIDPFYESYKTIKIYDKDLEVSATLAPTVSIRSLARWILVFKKKSIANHESLLVIPRHPYDVPGTMD